MTDLATWLRDNPITQAAYNGLAPALPVLGRMAVDAAIQTVKGLAANDPAAWVELRQNSTDEEWAAIAAKLTSDGCAAAKLAVENKDYIVGVLLSVLLNAATAAKGMVTG